MELAEKQQLKASTLNLIVVNWHEFAVAKITSACHFDARASSIIICKFPVKLPFPVYSGLQRASTSRHIHSPAGCRLPSPDRHCIMCACVHVNTYSLYTSYSVLGLRSVMTTALDSDERLV